MRSRVGRAAVVIGVIAATCVGLSGVPTAAGEIADKPVTVTVSVIGSKTGGLIAYLNEVEDGVDAAKKSIEKNGDVAFDLEVCDGAGNQNQLRKCGEDAVAADVDVAIVGDAAQAAAGLVDAFAAAEIPAFYVTTATGAEDNAPNAMLPVSPSISLLGGVGLAAARLGYKKDAAFVRPEAAASLAKFLELGYSGAGGELTSTISSPFAVPGAPNPPDLAPIAQKIVDESPKVVLQGFTDVTQELRVAGYDGPIVGVGTPNEILATLDSSATHDLFQVGQNPPFFLKKELPIIKRFRKELKAVGHDELANTDVFAWNAWQEMYAIAEQAKLMGGDFTGPEFLEALNESPGIELVTGRMWVPSAPGPSSFRGASLIVYWITEYVGDGKWKLVKTPPDGNAAPVEYFDEE